VRDVAIESFRLTAGLLNAGSNFLCRFEVEVEYGDARPLAAKSAAGRPANAATATRNDDGFVFETLHGSSRFPETPFAELAILRQIRCNRQLAKSAFTPALPCPGPLLVRRQTLQL